MNTQSLKVLLDDLEGITREQKYIAHKSLIVRTLSEKSVKNTATILKDNNKNICRSIMTLCYDAMNGITEKEPPKDWLSYVFYHILNKSFPQAVPIQLYSEHDTACSFFISVLNSFFKYCKSIYSDEWLKRNVLSFLTAEEEDSLENPQEYRSFIKAYNEEYIYEMMVMSEEVTGFNTLDHICGVHYLALGIGRQLRKTKLPIDMGRVSGGAAGHDIGKYGCKVSEGNRVPYLHYYYTDYWFKKHNITYIGHIAVNHSTWDLELENLPLESLILIYADFRVKNIDDGSGKKAMKIISLKEAFNTILNMLDNLTEEKTKRYRKVYNKLKDFEEYMIHLGIDVDLTNKKTNIKKEDSIQIFSLMQGNAIVDNMKYNAINHNIKLMYKLRNESSLGDILEEARNEKEWRNLREYLRIFEEYSTYLTQRQKLMVLKFLYSQMESQEEDVRRHCAQFIGGLIAIFDEDYRKEVPKDVVLESPEVTSLQLLDEYFKLFINPDSRIITAHRNWIMYCTGIMVNAFFTKSHKNQNNEYRKLLISYFVNDIYRTEEKMIFMLQPLKAIPIEDDTAAEEVMLDFIYMAITNNDKLIKIAALDTLDSILPQLTLSCEKFKKTIDYLVENINESSVPTQKHLTKNILKNIDCDMVAYGNLNEKYNITLNEISTVFLKNLKTETHWIVKKIQLDILLNHALNNPESNGFHTAMHFCNILKVSEMEIVRNGAGAALVKLMPSLSMEQRNDVVVELLRALEIEGYRFSGYIPHYLGQVMSYLQLGELEEITNDLTAKIKQGNQQLSCLIIRAIGINIVNNLLIKPTTEITNKGIDAINLRLLRAIMNGLADSNFQVRQAAFSSLGKEFFDNNKLDHIQKYIVFKLIAKKVLTLLTDVKDRELQFLSNSAAFNHIYRFIAEYILNEGDIELDIPKKIAFFLGGFDPFTLGHKDVATQIRDMGYDVYIAIDEFSWARRAHPNLLRRNIVNMTIADEFNVYIFPDDYPINRSNTKDLKQLINFFPDSKIYMVAGTDVLQHVDAYKTKNIKGSILEFPHIIYNRIKEDLYHNEQNLQNIIKTIKGEVIRIELSNNFKDISAAKVRENIDQNNEITSLIDPFAQQYIYDCGVISK